MSLFRNGAPAISYRLRRPGLIAHGSFRLILPRILRQSLSYCRLAAFPENRVLVNTLSASFQQGWRQILLPLRQSPGFLLAGRCLVGGASSHNPGAASEGRDRSNVWCRAFRKW